jgi:hypothetical protein
MLLESLERRDANPKTSALGLAVSLGTIGDQHRDGSEEREVPRWHVPEPPQRASRGE